MRKKLGNSNRQLSATRARSATASKANAPTWHKTLATNLRRIRADRHITLETLVRKTGYTLEFVKKVEKAQVPELLLAHTEPFAKALRVSVIYLLRPRRRSKDA